MHRAATVVVLVLALSFAAATRLHADCRPLADATLVVNGFATDLADDALRLSATLTPPAAFDPAVAGFTLVLENEFTSRFVDAVVPGGGDWRATANGGWSYRDPSGAAGAISRVKIKPLRDGTLAIRIDGRRGDYARSTDIVPIHVSLLIPDCAEVYLSTSRCRFAASGNTLRCSPPPAQRRCGATAEQQVRCDALNAAAAEDAYLAVHGAYYSGDCIGLPGFTPSPGVICLVAAALDLEYSVVTASPYASVSCVYSSHPDHPDDPNLVCS